MRTLHLGLDENGLGPRLGPLVVTVAAASGAGTALLTPLPRAKSLAALLGDSKEMASFADSSLGEAWARALYTHRGLGELESPAALLDYLLHDQPTLRAPCPPQHAAQCWGNGGEDFTADASLVDACRRALDYLARRELTLEHFRSTLVCSARLNEGGRHGLSRLQMDLHAMETLVLASASADVEVDAVLGKVGGYGFYGDVFGPLAGRLHVALEESRPRSSYRFPGLGTLSFVMDADASHTLVALASLVGKWVRDTFMRRVVRHHQALVGEELPYASGYHDPVTARFVERTALTRKRVQFPDDCFERITAPKKPAKTKR